MGYWGDGLEEGGPVELAEIVSHKLLIVFAFPALEFHFGEGEGKVVGAAAFDVALEKVVRKESHSVTVRLVSRGTVTIIGYVDYQSITIDYVNQVT